jgi:hypothetical protein
MGIKNYDVKPGDKYNSWTIIERFIDSDSRQKCLVECSCENKTRRIKRISHILSGKAKSCGCKMQRTDISIKYPNSRASKIIYGIRGGAKVRDIFFDLGDELETFEKYCLGSCFYCGIKSNWPETHNGIDRFDNDKGYVEGNCVSCCHQCNSAKNNFDIEDFKFKLNKLYDFFILNNKNEWLDDDVKIKTGTKIIDITGRNFGKRRTELGRKYPESYNLGYGSYAQTIWRHVYDHCKETMNKKKLEITLNPLKAFEEYILGTCNYCGLKPQFPHTRNGIDRVDSSKGYTEDNCISSCTFCNRAKLDSTIDEFKEWVIRAYSNLTTIGWDINNII